MDWFLYNKDLRHERVKEENSGGIASVTLNTTIRY